MTLFTVKVSLPSSRTDIGRLFHLCWLVLTAVIVAASAGAGCAGKPSPFDSRPGQRHPVTGVVTDEVFTGRMVSEYTNGRLIRAAMINDQDREFMIFGYDREGNVTNLIEIPTEFPEREEGVML